MYAFEYHRPHTLSGAVADLANPDAKALAGGMTLLPTMKQRLASPAALIDLKSVHELAGIARDKNRSEKMRSSALLWIGQSGVPNRVPLLDDIYKNGGDSLKLRTQILFALSQTHDPQAVSILGNIAASDPDFALRKQAVMWLGQMKSPEATQALENILRKK